MTQDTYKPPGDLPEAQEILDRLNAPDAPHPGQSPAPAIWPEDLRLYLKEQFFSADCAEDRTATLRLACALAERKVS